MAHAINVSRRFTRPPAAASEFLGVSRLSPYTSKDRTGEYKLNALSNLGFALIELGEFGEAETVLAEALKLKLDDAEASSNWSLLPARNGLNLDEALDRAKKTAVCGDYTQLLHTLGIVHFKRGELDLAVEPLKKAAEVRKERPRGGRLAHARCGLRS